MRQIPQVASMALITLMLSSNATAHVRWFVEETATTSSVFSWSPIYFLVLMASVGFCSICYAMNKAENAITKQHPVLFGTWPFSGQWRLLAMAVGVCFMINTLGDTFIAPNLPAMTALSPMHLSQLLCALVLISGMLRPAAIAIILTLALALALAPPSLWLDYGPEFIGIALCLWYYQRPQTSLSCLRIGFGIQLIILAIHNKLANPQLGLEFLSHYSWNFVQLLGYKSFSNLEFVFCAGMAELCFGIAIMMGWSTRLVTFLTLSFFVLTSFLLGVHELIGHLPIVGVGVMLITLGGGHKLPWQHRYQAKRAEQNESPQRISRSAE